MLKEDSILKHSTHSIDRTYICGDAASMPCTSSPFFRLRLGKAITITSRSNRVFVVDLPGEVAAEVLTATPTGSRKVVTIHFEGVKLKAILNNGRIGGVLHNFTDSQFNTTVDEYYSQALPDGLGVIANSSSVFVGEVRKRSPVGRGILLSSNLTFELFTPSREDPDRTDVLFLSLGSVPYYRTYFVRTSEEEAVKHRLRMKDLAGKSFTSENDLTPGTLSFWASGFRAEVTGPLLESTVKVPVTKQISLDFGGRVIAKSFICTVKNPIEVFFRTKLASLLEEERAAELKEREEREKKMAEENSTASEQTPEATPQVSS